MQGLRSQLKGITKHISSGLAALREEKFSAASTAFLQAEQYAQQTKNSHKNILKAVEQDCEDEDNPCHEDEEFLGVVGNNWTVCANLDHAVKNAGKKNRLVDIYSTVDFAVNNDEIYFDHRENREVFLSPGTIKEWNGVLAEKHKQEKVIEVVTAITLSDKEFDFKLDRKIWTHQGYNEYK